jgi:hypothetical protein
MSSIVVAILIPIGLILAAIVLVRNRGKQFAALAERGIPAMATVSRRFTTAGGGTGRVKRIGFTYAGPDGRQYERFASVGQGHYRDVAEGDPFPIVFLPDDPGTSAPAWLVDAARQAVTKRQ